MERTRRQDYVYGFGFAEKTIKNEEAQVEKEKKSPAIVEEEIGKVVRM